MEYQFVERVHGVCSCIHDSSFFMYSSNSYEGLETLSISDESY